MEYFELNDWETVKLTYKALRAPMTCNYCGDTLTRNNWGGIFGFNGAVRSVCNNIVCLSEHVAAEEGDQCETKTDVPKPLCKSNVQYGDDPLYDFNGVKFALKYFKHKMQKHPDLKLDSGKHLLLLCLLDDAFPDFANDEKSEDVDFCEDHWTAYPDWSKYCGVKTDDKKPK